MLKQSKKAMIFFVFSAHHLHIKGILSMPLYFSVKGLKLQESSVLSLNCFSFSASIFKQKGNSFLERKSKSTTLTLDFQEY